MTSLAEISETCVMQTLRAAARRVTRVYEQALAPTGLTASQFSTLVAVGRDEGVPLSVLAQRLDMDRTTMNRVLKPLERRRLVTLAGDARDARVRTVSLGPAAPTVMAQAAALWAEAQREVTAGIADWDRLRTEIEGLG